MEIRYDPIKDQKVAYSIKRQNRTFHPKREYCPLCPTISDGMETDIPEKDYYIVVFENKFPTFAENPDAVRNASSFYTKHESKGICEVICYTPVHDVFLEDLPHDNIVDLVKVWKDRYIALGKKDFIKYVYIFENKGKEIGVTLSHPHGQVYAFSYIPPVVEQELISSEKFYSQKKECIHCMIIKEEAADKGRIVSKNNDFIAFIPYYAKWPYEVHIYSRRHIDSLKDFTIKEMDSLAKMLKGLVSKYNNLFNFRMPYVMAIHQRPTDGGNYEYYHFHIEFYPPYRTKDKLKYLAGCELGAGTFINDTLPEEKARELRESG